METANDRSVTRTVSMDLADWVPSWKNEERPALKLIGFPFAGGTAAAFRGLRMALKNGASLLGVDPPGRASRFREPAFVSMQPLVATALQVLRPLFVEPYAIFGHSMGAAVAFELVRVLQSRRLPLPVVLFVSGRHAPQVSRPEQRRHLADDQTLIREVMSYGGIPAFVLEEKELLEWMIRVLRADYELIDTYRYEAGEVLSCPIVAFGGDSDPLVSRSELAGWEAHTDRGFELFEFSGGHFFYRDHERAIADRIRDALVRWKGIE